MNFLSHDDLKQLTGYQYPAKIIKGLREMGIEHRVRPDGFPIVSTSHVENILGGSAESKQHGGEPNYGAL